MTATPSMTTPPVSIWLAAAMAPGGSGPRRASTTPRAQHTGASRTSRAPAPAACSSFTKTLAPGYRVGWAAPGRFREQVEQLKFAQSVATPTLPQMAIAEFIENGGYEHHLRAIRRKLATQVEQVSAAIAEHFPAGTRVSRPAGGFVLWVELPPGTNALELHARALAQQISVAPGPIFSAKPRFANCIRMSCGFPWSDLLAHAVRTLGRLAREVAERGDP